MTRFPISALTLALGAACSGETGRESLDAPAVELVEELRLDPNVEDFSVVNRLSVGTQRQIVVAQPQDRQLRLYDSSGTRIAVVGREGGGSGPGEFRSLGTMGWIADTLWVFDISQRRVTYIASTGDVLRTAVLPAAAARGAPVQGEARKVGSFGPSAISADGGMLGEGRIETQDDSRLGGAWPERVLLYVPPAQAGDPAPPATEPSVRSARVVARPPAYEDPRWFMEVAGFGRYIPFAATPLVAYASDGSRFAYLTTEMADETGGTFTLTVFDATGDTTVSRSHPYRGIAVPQHVRDSVLDAFIPPEGRPREGPADLPQRFQAIAREKMPPIYPPVMAMVLGLDDSIWLTMRDTADARRALILDGEGEPIGTFPLPPRATIRQATSTHVWMTQTDEDGLATVLRYRVSGRR